jgi:D-serine deaminase-like pyridoxal phosphate-dependent protein
MNKDNNPKSLNDIDTPYLVVDLDDVEHNIDTLMKRLSRFPKVSVRPHQKTAKSPAFAKMALERGAKGICVAKISEAEVFVKEGITDILITTEIAGEVKIARLFALLRGTPDTKIVVDNANVVMQLKYAHGAASLPKQIQVLIDYNVGQDRTGVNSEEEVLSLAHAISEVGGLKLVGIQGYEGHIQHLDAITRESHCRAAMKKLVSAADALRKSGYDIEIVTTGGTGTAEICASVDGITEVQPGSFIFMDVAYRNATDAAYRNALKLVSTVISKSSDHRVILDAGTKSLSVDMGNAEPFHRPSWSYRPAGDEHGILESEVDLIELVPGDRIAMLPSHIDTTVALHDTFHIVRGDHFIGLWPIAARGKVQ